MLEARGNLWDYPANFRVITTNGTVKRNGACVMGRGCAREARDRFPGLDLELGRRIRNEGNHVHVLSNSGVIAFPVKHNWWEQADPSLIERSAYELREVADGLGGILTNAPEDMLPYIDMDVRYVMPRPGCGNGGLTWDVVKPIIEPVLDDRFTVITF